MRSICVAVFLAVLVPLGAASTTYAKGTPLKGQLVKAGWNVPGTTGNCTCDIQWYTVGLGPGKARIDGALHTYQMDYSISYALRVTVYRGSQMVGFGQAACAKKQRTCHDVAHIRFTVSHPGVYYIKADGPGAEGVSYTISIRGTPRALHCSKVCN